MKDFKEFIDDFLFLFFVFYVEPHVCLKLHLYHLESENASPWSVQLANDNGISKVAHNDKNHTAIKLL